jgi:hypothetical protein
MHKIQKESWGYHLTFGDSMSAEEMQLWVDESKSVLRTAPRSFGVFVDMRNLRPLSVAARAVMLEGQKLYKRKGMRRSVVILASALITMQFRRLAKESGIYEWERYIDASAVPNWEEAGIAWLRHQLDPDA